MENNKPTFWRITFCTVAVHTITYFITGILAYTILDYRTHFASEGLSSFMRQIDDPMVMAGPLFQPIRGILFGVVFFLLRDVFFGTKNGWIKMWIVLVVVGIFSTFGPSPGSVEGLVYTTVPVVVQLVGLIEVLLQSFLLSCVVVYWVNHPEKRWITWVAAAGFVIIVAMPALGLLMERP
ncbi:MAG: hypothetical protein OEQ28_10850 [Acidobacteriota bacterium]|nr:hypothetical protein [Acidobacteriota bacterium]